MPDPHVSSDRLSQDTRPETPRLLLEGRATIPTTSFSAVTGGFQGFVTVDITTINDIGNTNKGAFSDRATYRVEVFHIRISTSEFDIFSPVPFIDYYNPSSGVYDYTGQVRHYATFDVVNQHVLLGDVYNSTLTFTYFASHNDGTFTQGAGFSQTFLYKVWSVPFINE